MDIDGKVSKLKWGPIESNPDILNNIKNLLLANNDELTQLEFSDIFSLEEEYFSWVAQPLQGCLLLFPTNKEYGNVINEKITNFDDIFYIKQIKGLGNACGLIGVIHLLSNIALKYHIQLNDSVLKRFMDTNSNKTAEEIGNSLSLSHEINQIHAKMYMKGKTTTTKSTSKSTLNESKNIQKLSDGQEDEQTNNHFIAYVTVNNELLEFDGIQGVTKVKPYDPNNLLKSIVDWIKKKYIMPNPDTIGYNLMAFSGILPSQFK